MTNGQKMIFLNVSDDIQGDPKVLVLHRKIHFSPLRQIEKCSKLDG